MAIVAIDSLNTPDYRYQKRDQSKTGNPVLHQVPHSLHLRSLHSKHVTRGNREFSLDGIQSFVTPSSKVLSQIPSHLGPG